MIFDRSQSFQVLAVYNGTGTVYLLRTDCKLNHFVNSPPLKIGPNGLKAGQTAWKLAEWFTSSPNGMQGWPSNLLKHTSKAVSQARPNQRQRGSHTESDLRWHWLGLTCETNK